MNEHDFLSLHAQKATEYLLGAAYLLLFIPFWKFVSSPMAETESQAATAARNLFDWFQLPEGLFLHPGHVWARTEGAGSVAVGLDDFGHRLVGPVSAILTPKVGEAVRKGEPAFSLVSDGKKFDLLAPVDGVIAAVNARATSAPGTIHSDPYDSGWVLKIVPKKLSEDLKDLLSGDAARRFLEGAAERLMPQMQPAMITVQDGGAPVHGIAKEVDPEKWDEVVRSHFLTN